MTSSGMLRRVALVRPDVSEEPSSSIIRTKIDELACDPDYGGTTFLRNVGS
jgi:hypothetical protein